MSKIAFTPHETQLLEQAIEFVKESKEMPSREALRRHLGCGAVTSQKIRTYILEFEGAVVPVPVAVKSEQPESILQEKNTMTTDTWEIVLPKSEIHTLAALMKAFDVDENVWEVERWEANKWAMGFVASKVRTEGPKGEGQERTITEENTPGSQPLYQCKAKFRRKQFNTLSEYAKDNAKMRRKVERLTLECNSEREIARRLAKNHAGFDELLENMKEFMQVIGDWQLPYERVQHNPAQIVPAVRGGHTEDAVLLLSDTHFGDRIRRGDTSGFPEFDLVIAGNRWGYTIGKAKQCLALHRAMYPIKKLIVWIGGDIGNGVLHDAPQSNELFVPAQVHFSYHMFKFAIEDLLTLTKPDENGNVVVEEIELLFTVGNHMRMDEKMPTKLQAQRTFDWLIYQMLIDRFEHNPKVHITKDMAPYIFHNIRGHRYMFAHGMQVGYRNSPDAQCKSMSQFIDRARALFDSPEWRRANNLQNETFSRICIGDIHVPVSFPRLKSNGSLNGQNELGVNWTLEPIPAGMQLFGVADKHQETWQYFLECTHIQKKAEDFNKYGTFAADYAREFGR